LFPYVEWDRFVTLTGAQAEWGLRYRIYHSTYGSSAQSDSHRAVFCPNSVVSGWKN
jgi:hypothetical protein